MIGYYAHHHGSGHVFRAAALARSLRPSGVPVTILTSAQPRDAQSFESWVRLPTDAAGDPGLDNPVPDDPTANGGLHWAPLHHRGLQERMSAIVAWIERARPAAMVVDVSVEVAVLARLCGVPVVLMAMPGHRADAAHQLGFRFATRIIAPWPREFYAPSWLQAFEAKTDYVGAFSRFSDLPTAPQRGGHHRVLVLCGAGGSSCTDEDLSSLRAAWPQLQWDVLGGPGHWRDDVWQRLGAADVVISHAGQNAVAEIAAARRPAILVPEGRPHDEQLHAARAVARSGGAAVCRDWREVAGRLSQPLPAAQGWDRWAPDGALQRAARNIVEVVRECGG